METKKILGLDIGTNSIGGALINLPIKIEDYGKAGNLEWLGSRIIPIDGDYLQKFESGSQAETKAAFRRGKRGSRRLKHRYKLRRTRLIKVFKGLEWIDSGFPLDESRKFKQNINENGYSLKISDYLPFSEETIIEFEKEFGIEGKKSKKKGSRQGGKSIVPEDWIVYFLRKKALEKVITVSELARIIYMLNQRRGFKSSRKDLKDTNVMPYEEFIRQKENKDFGENGIETQFVSITKIKSVTFKEEKIVKKGKTENVTYVYTIEAEDPRMQTWEETRVKEPDWAKETNDKGEKISKKEFTFLVVQKVDKNGKYTQNKPQIPKDDDWSLCTTALSEKIDENNQHPGEYFYEQMKEAYKAKRNFKARQYPVYRWRYQKELEAIWRKQCELNPKLKELNSDKSILIKMAEILYPTQAKNNMPKLAEFQSKDLLHIISNDIIYYQRELKSQKNTISECRYEKRKGIDGEFYGLKCIPRSSPLFQEFRIWQDIHNIRVLEREVIENGKTKLDIDVTGDFINDEVKEKLFDLFNSKISINEKDILSKLKENYPDSNIKLDIDKKEKVHSHKINLFARRDELKGNESLSRYRSVFKKAGFDGDAILNDNGKLFKLWHLDYSITSSDEEKSKKGITTALNKLLPENENKQKVIDAFCKLSELKREYGSFSAFAIKKLLPVMRCGKYWYAQDISEDTKKRADQIKERLNSINNSIKRLNEIADDDVQKQTIISFIGREDLTKGLNTYQAGYLIYDIHSEKVKTPINSIEEFGKYIQKEIPNNSLRNPVVEKVVRETMFLVRDVWNKYGQIDEIHIELGRNLKNNSKERQRISETQDGNFKEKQRIKALLYELMNGFEQHLDEDEEKPFKFENGNFKWDTKIENTNFAVKPNPESPADIDKFRIWRSLNKQSEFDWAKKVKDEKIPTKVEIKKYALWLSQNCRSPYTGKIIPLSKLFDKNLYEVEHVLPRVRIKNDSFNNLVISEWGVNKAKDKELAANFISSSNGKCKYGDKEYTLFTYEQYEAYCNNTFKFQKSKLKNLLATEVPEDFIDRQLNDTRYIGRKLSELLAPVTKSENGIIFTGGIITSELKKNWGLNKVWKEIVKPRFESLNEIYQHTEDYKSRKEKLDRIFSEKNNDGTIKRNAEETFIIGNYKKRYECILSKIKSKYIINDIDELGNPVFHFNVKENEKLDTKRIDHRHHALDALVIAATTREHIRYLNTLNAADTDNEFNLFRRTLVKRKIRDFIEPWENFTKDAKNKLEETIVTFKTNERIISTPKNRTVYLKIENGKAKKDFKEQQPNKNWMAVRQSLFAEQPHGKVYIKEVIKKGFKSPNERLNIIKLQIERMSAQNTPKQKIASYIYDQELREEINKIIDISDGNLEIIEDYLKKYNPKGLNNDPITSIRIAEFHAYAVKRTPISKDFDHKTIDKIPYGNREKSRIPKAMHDHLLEFEKIKLGIEDLIWKDGQLKYLDNQTTYKPLELKKTAISNLLKEAQSDAFSEEGLELLDKKLGMKIRVVSLMDGRIDKKENKKIELKNKLVQSDGNPYYLIYENIETKERKGYKSLNIYEIIKRKMEERPLVDELDGHKSIILKPNDLVYMPIVGKNGIIIEDLSQIDWKNLTKEQIKRVYKVNDFSGVTIYFAPVHFAKAVAPKELDTSFDYKLSKDSKGNSIKEHCIKLLVDRLGNIKPAN